MDNQTESVIIRAEKLYDQARQLALENDLDSALDYITKAESEFLSINHVKWLAFARHEKFRMLLENNQVEAARGLIDDIRLGYTKTGDYHGLALLLIHESYLLSNDKAYKEALSKLRIAEAIVKNHRLNGLSGYLQSSISINLMAMQNYCDAIQSLELAIVNYADDRHSIERNRCFWNLAVCYRNTYQFKEAEKYYNAAFKAYTQEGDNQACLEILNELKTLFARQDKKTWERQINERIQDLNHQREGYISENGEE